MADLTLEATAPAGSGGAASLTEINPLQVDLLPAEAIAASNYVSSGPHSTLGTALRRNEQIAVAGLFQSVDVRTRTYGEGNYGDGNYGTERYTIDLGNAVVDPVTAQPAVYTHHSQAQPLGTAIHITGCTTFTPPSSSSYGASHGHSDATGTLLVDLGLAGTSDGTATTTGTLGLLLDLTGTAAGTSTGQGTLGRAVPLNGGTATGDATTTGTLTVHSPTPQPLAGTAAGHSAASGTLSITLAPVIAPPYIQMRSVRTAVHSPAGVRFHQQIRRRVS